jgi:sensor histidine kinase YesM
MENDANNWFESLLTSPRLRIARHLLLQLLILLLSLNTLGSESEMFVLSGERLWGLFLFYVVLNILCYLNIYVLTPRTLLKGRIDRYIGVIIAFVIAFILLAILTQPIHSDEYTYNSMPLLSILIEMTSSFLSICLVFIATSTMVLLVEWMKEQKRVGELKIATKQSELNMLKQQINPHFLFNMLNNVNVLLKCNPKEASQALLKLEKLLDYQLNDSTKEFVKLDSDISFLNDFLNLEKIRRDRFDYSITKAGDSGAIKVPPFLFIPFVENAVKHNPDIENESYIHIKFEIKDGELRFRCENSKPAIPLAKGKIGGLGLQNIRRRLELLYPNRHTLSITDEDKQFTVFLIIKQQ